MNEYNIKINEKENIVKIISDKVVNVNNQNYQYEIIEIENNNFILKLDERMFQIVPISKSDINHIILVNNTQLNLSIRTSLEAKAYKLLSSAESSGEKKTNVKSPMPGLVLKMLKSNGDKVNKGETVLILEAMKMENEIKSPLDGIISEIFVEQGKPIEKNINLFSIK